MFHPNPYRTIWLHPRTTVRRIVMENPDLHVVLLACLMGVGRALNRASTRNMGDRLGATFEDQGIATVIIVMLACVLGPLGGLIMLWIYSHLIRWTGQWMGGTSPRQHIRTALAWGAVPLVFALPLWIPQLAMAGSEMFTSQTPGIDAQPVLLGILFAIALIEIILAIWAMVLVCNAVAEVQGYRSAWAGLGNILLAGLTLIVPVMALGVVLYLLAPKG